MTNGVKSLRPGLFGRGGTRAWLWLSVAVAAIPVGTGAQTVTWDAGDETTDTIENADGVWNNDVGGPAPWNDGTGGQEYQTGDDVIFSEADGPATVTVIIGENVAPGSITFESDPDFDTTFIINSTDPSNEIFSFNGNAPFSSMEIEMGDAATINAGLNGNFWVTGSETLTLGGQSLNLRELTVASDLTLRIAASAELDGRIFVDDGTLVVNGTVDQIYNGVNGVVDVNAGGRTTGRIENRNVATIAGNVDYLINFGGAEVTFDGSMELGARGFENEGDAEILEDVTVTGNAETRAGTFTIDTGGVMNGDIDVRNSAVLDVNGSVTGEISNGATTNLAGSVGSIDNRADGTLTVDGDSSVTSLLTSSGDIYVTNDSELTANILNAGDGVVEVRSGSTLIGNLESSGGGDVEIRGVMTGDLDNSGDGDVVITNRVNGNVINSADGFIDLNGRVTGTLTNSGNADLGGNIGALVNEFGGDVVFDAATTIAGTAINRGDWTVNSGVTAAVSDGTTNESGAEIDIRAGGVMGGPIVNQAGGEVYVGGRVAGLLTNEASGFVELQGGSVVSGRINNAGDLNVLGTTTIRVLSNTGTVDMTTDNATGGRLIISETGALNGTIRIDSDLSGYTAQTDRIVAESGAVLSGNVNLDFNNVSGIFGSLLNPVTVMTYGSDSTITATATGLAGVGGLVYYLNRRAEGIDVITAQNPGVGGVAGAVTLTQSLIGSVINRPSSPYIAGVAPEDGNRCQPGAWGRAIGGHASASGTTRSEVAGANGLNYDSKISASYAGLQFGGDLTCFDGLLPGWDLSFGGIGGVNLGQTSQPVFAIDPSSGTIIPGIIVSDNETDFQQAYGGVYLSAVRGRLLLDLQYRLEKTSFDISNTGTEDERIGLIDQKFESDAQTLSGSVSYAFPLNEERGLNFVPTMGFAYTKSSTDPIYFEDDARLEIDDATTEVAFVGGTVSMTKIRPGGQSALTYFATGTLYKDFADETRSTYYASPTGDGVESYSSNLGQYTEASIGLNYTRLLERGKAPLNARQMSASVRLDGRFGETLDSWGVTGQVRFQF